MKAVASPNIALIKYWGKRFSFPQSDLQLNLPCNPSLGFTLSKAKTISEFFINNDTNPKITVNDKAASAKDFRKITKHVKRIDLEFSLKPQNYSLVSGNNFPTGTGLASSSSAFASLTLSYLAFRFGREKALKILNDDNSLFSELSRMGSGSAARACAGGFTLWDNESAKKIKSAWVLYDSIIVLDSKAKSISSTEGHMLAQSSPLFENRLAEIQIRLQNIQEAIDTKDIHKLGPIIEDETLCMHAVMETSTPRVSYLNNQSEQIVRYLANQNIRDFYFTMDAGPNIHLISERPIKAEVEEMLSKLQIRANIWEDRLGSGPYLE